MMPKHVVTAFIAALTLAVLACGAKAPTQVTADIIAEESVCCLLDIPSTIAGYDASDDSIAGCSNGIYWLYFSNYPPQCCDKNSDCIDHANGWYCYLGDGGVADDPDPHPDFPPQERPPPPELPRELVPGVGKCCPPLLPEAQATNYPGCPTT
jgi:hypothetical protein